MHFVARQDFPRDLQRDFGRTSDRVRLQHLNKQQPIQTLAPNSSDQICW